MDKVLKRICGMLQSPDGMRRCAAAITLAELAPKDPAVVARLGEALKDGSQLLTKYVLEAFDAIGTRAVVPHVLVLLEAEDMEVKLRAAGIVARVGGEMVDVLHRQFEKAGPMQKRVLLDILARIHTRPAMKIILDALFDPDFEVVREACQAVRRHVTDATPADRRLLHQQVVKFMNSARVKKHERVLTSCLLLIGYIGAPDARHILLKHTSKKHLGYIRRNALLGLKGLEITGSAARQVVRVMLNYLADPDPVIVQHALDIIEKLPLPATLTAQWRKLLKNKHAPVRAFAARKLAATDNAAINRLMMSLLAHEDAQVGEIAAGALARHKGAIKLLLGALARERHPEKAWRLAKILKPHSERVDKKTLRRFAALAARAVEKAEPRREALFYFVRNVDPKIADSVLREVGLRFKGARKWSRAVHCLRQLTHAEAFDTELRFDLSVCNLKQSPRDLAPHLRADDPCLRGFQALLADKRFKLFDRMTREKALDTADLYYVGFHFSEGTGEEARFGQKLLGHIAKRWPKSKEGKAARNKLKLAGQSAATGT
jgi:hypothetical protein